MNHTIAFAIKSICLSRRCFALITCGITCVIALGQNPADGQDKNIDGAYLLKNATSKWLEYAAFLRTLQGAEASRRHFDGKDIYVATSLIKRNLDCVLVERRIDVSGHSAYAKKGLVWCYNPKYLFSLECKLEDNKWAIVDLDTRVDKKNSNMKETIEDATGFVRIMTRIGLQDLADLIKQPKFKVIAAKKIDHKGVDAIRIEFDNSHPIETKPFVAIQSGFMVLDPVRSWALREFEIRTLHSNGSGKIHGELSCRDSKMGFPIPVQYAERKEFSNSETGKLQIGTEQVDFDLNEANPFPENAEFVLSVFGLPDPVSITPPLQNRNWFWYTVISISGIAIVVLVRRRLHAIQASKS